MASRPTFLILWTMWIGANFSPNTSVFTCQLGSSTHQVHQHFRITQRVKVNSAMHTAVPAHTPKRVRGCITSTYSPPHWYCCLLASGWPLASRQQYLFDKCLLLYVQSLRPDDGWKDCSKHVECHSKINKFDTLVHLVGFTIGIMCDFNNTNSG